MDETVERRIRDRAYRIWEEEGQPAGRDVDHWLRAAQEIAAEAHGSSGPDKATDKATPPAAETAEAKPSKAKRPRAQKSKDAAGETSAEAGKVKTAKRRRSPG